MLRSLESLKPAIELAIIETFVVSGASTDEEVKRVGKEHIEFQQIQASL